MDPMHIAFDTHSGLEQQWLSCIGRSQHQLRVFDPDLDVFQLGRSDVEAALRHFLHEGGHLFLAMHDPAHVQLHCPRFLNLIKDYGHRIECRQTPASLRQLTDSFAIGDELHVVRRFHCAHLRGMAEFDDPAALETPVDRFQAIWAESKSTLHATTIGL